MSPTWEELVSGSACPMDYPRPEGTQFGYFVTKLSVSSLYLDRNQAYRGHCVLIYDFGHATRLDQLSPEQWSAFATDLHVSETAIFKTFQPDHMNVESLGNVMQHLHWHIVPRFKSDGRWGGPIWTSGSADMPRTELEAHEYSARAAGINHMIETYMRGRAGPSMPDGTGC